MRRRTLLAGLGAAVALVLGSACGGGAVSTAGQPLTKAEWIAQADSICAKANSQIEALGEPADAGELAVMTKQAVAVNDRALESIRALPPPSEIEVDVARALDLSEQQNELARAIATAADKRDQREVQRLVAELTPLQSEAKAIAREIGLAECGKG